MKHHKQLIGSLVTTFTGKRGTVEAVVRDSSGRPERDRVRVTVVCRLSAPITISCLYLVCDVWPAHPATA